MLLYECGARSNHRKTQLLSKLLCTPFTIRLITNHLQALRININIKFKLVQTIYDKVLHNSVLISLESSKPLFI